MNDPSVPPDSVRIYGDRRPAHAARGKLKIFFGAFPGVGKTYQMLAAGRRLKEAGRDVVVGVAETHGAPETEAILASLETLSPPAPDAAPLPGELDLDAVLARRPEVVLVDDLAHANPPGFRHPRRWNDVDEILAAGVDVFTAMSVQQLESLRDVVGEITGLPAGGETVPDTFFDSAEETVIVDMSADELLARLRAGQVRGRQVEADTARKFFRKGNLLALRELALRRTAEVVEHEVQKYRVEQEIGSVWKTQGHLLCCIGPSEGTEHVVRSAARLAAQLGVPWTAAYVETPKLQRLPAPERARILKVVSLAEELGARTAILTGEDAAGAILDYARSENISTIALGRSPRPRFHVLRSLSERLAGENEDIDLIEIGAGGREQGASIKAAPQTLDAAGPRAAEKRLRYAWATGLCIAATLVALALRPQLELANIVLIFMLAVILAAVRWGRGPAIYAAIVNVVAFNFFFVPPLHSFHVTDPEYLVTFAVMLAVGVVTGQLAGSLRFQARVAAHRERRARTLYELARDLAQKQTTSQVVEATEQFMGRHIRGRVAILVPDATGTLVSPTGHGMTNPFDSTTAQWAYDHAKPAGAGTDTMASNEHLFLPLRSPTLNRGVLAIRPERVRDLMIPEQRRQFDIFAALVATALERVHYVDVARDALLLARLRSGEDPPQRSAHAVGEIAAAALRSLGAVLSKHAVTLDIPRDLPQVLVDPALAERVFASLVGNVAKHTPAGTPVTVAARRAGDFVEVAIADEGPGLPAGREEQIFESFARGDGGGSPKRGAGLGLSIVRTIVKAHGGEISAERGREKGTRIVFTLPIPAGAAEA